MMLRAADGHRWLRAACGAGLVAYHRGLLRILDRVKVEKDILRVLPKDNAPC